MARLYVNDVLVDPNYDLKPRNQATWPEEYDHNVKVLEHAGHAQMKLHVPNVYWGRGLGRVKTEVTWFHVHQLHKSYKLPKAYLLEQLISD